MEVVTTIKAKKQGNSISVTMPVQLDVRVGTCYMIYKKDNGTLLLIPKLENIFDSVSDGAYSQQLEWNDFHSQGIEGKS